MAYNQYRAYFKDITVSPLLTDSFIRRTPGGGPDLSHFKLYKAETSIRRTTDTLKWSTDTCEVRM